MLKNAILFRLGSDWTAPDARALETALEKHSFEPCTPSQAFSAGWVPPRDQEHAALSESVSGHLILKLCVEKKSVPASVVKQTLKERCEQEEAQTGRAPSKKRKKEMKEEIVLDLLPRAFSKLSSSIVWLDPHTRTLVVGAGSKTAAQDAIKALVDTMADAGAILTVGELQTEVSPSTAMGTWLQTQEAPRNFTVDRECELVQPDSEKSVVKYSRHTLEIEEIAGHLRAGKVAKKLALTWNNQVSFMLTDALQLKKIAFIDVAMDSAAEGDEDTFDADAAIATGGLSQMLPDLIEALGGELPMGEGSGSGDGDGNPFDSEANADE